MAIQFEIENDSAYLTLSNDSVVKKPSYTITSFTLGKIASISEKMGEVKMARLSQPPVELRKKNRIKTIQSSLEIEGNTLTVEQITAIVENKRVLASQKDIMEVKNAIAAYAQLDSYKPYSITSLCNAHKQLMSGLAPSAGIMRASDVTDIKEIQPIPTALPAHLVKSQLQELLDYVRRDSDLLLIKSCVFHYEFGRIHPFPDGNKRMGCLWQTVLLRQQYPVFDYLPIESLIQKRQTDYYKTLAIAEQCGDSVAFVEFMLTIIDEALEELLQTRPIHFTSDDRIRLYQSIVNTSSFSRKEYMRHFKDISTAVASRDLKVATEKDIITKTGDGRLAVYAYV